MIISPKTKVGELLDEYPHLESVLIEMSPSFQKLKNPILRKTVAKVATLQQIAVVGGLKVDFIINRLRNEVGQQTEEGHDEESTIPAGSPPHWLDRSKIITVYDATPVINSGESPMKEILNRANTLKKGQIFELRTPFVPAPIIDMLKNKGFTIYSLQEMDGVKNYISMLK